MSQEFWPRWLMNGEYDDYTEPLYSYAGSSKWYSVWLENYDKLNYKVDSSGYWVNNAVSGRTWSQAQLYRIPGSKTVQFIVVNPWKAHTGQYGVTANPFVFKDIEETEDGYVLHAYRIATNDDSGNLMTYKMKKNLRLFENLRVSGIDKTSERLTEDNIAYYEGEMPYNVAYESDVMGNQSTPYVEPGVLEAGDVIRIIVDNNEVTYMKPVWRRSVGLVEPWCINHAEKPSSFFDREAITYGEIIGINGRTGTLKVRGWYWGRPDEPISSASAGYVKATNAIKQHTVDFFMYDTTAMWDEKRGIYGVATWGDYRIGDKILAVENLENGRPTKILLIKNHNK